jgi:hypothetical protein
VQRTQTQCLDGLSQGLESALNSVHQSAQAASTCLDGSVSAEASAGHDMQQLRRAQREACFAVDIAHKLEAEAEEHTMQVNPLSSLCTSMCDCDSCAPLIHGSNPDLCSTT